MGRERWGPRLRGRRQRRDSNRRLRSWRLGRVVPPLQLLVCWLSSCRLVMLLRWRWRCHLQTHIVAVVGCCQQDKLYVQCLCQQPRCSGGSDIPVQIHPHEVRVYRNCSLGSVRSVVEVDIRARGQGQGDAEGQAAVPT